MKGILSILLIILLSTSIQAQDLSLNQLLEIKKITVYKNNDIEDDVDDYLSSLGWELIEREKPSWTNFSGISKYKESDNNYPETPSLEYYYNLDTDYTRVYGSNYDEDRFNGYLDGIKKLGAALISSKKDKNGILQMVYEKENTTFILRKGSIDAVFTSVEIRSIRIMSTKDYNSNFSGDN